MNEIIPLKVENLCKCFSFWDFELTWKKENGLKTIL